VAEEGKSKGNRRAPGRVRPPSRRRSRVDLAAMCRRAARRPKRLVFVRRLGRGVLEACH